MYKIWTRYKIIKIICKISDVVKAHQGASILPKDQNLSQVQLSPLPSWWSQISPCATSLTKPWIWRCTNPGRVLAMAKPWGCSSDAVERCLPKPLLYQHKPRWFGTLIDKAEVKTVSLGEKRLCGTPSDGKRWHLLESCTILSACWYLFCFFSSLPPFSFVSLWPGVGLASEVGILSGCGFNVVSPWCSYGWEWASIAAFSACWSPTAASWGINQRGLGWKGP